ncbi:protein of unknown function (plasmid) [Magnetospirillum sp. XM-1]|uniref:hypothetical protein n=1 Tax=Magnetospirillum sp. XM-1 TaxID=1663591 RepID=UPI00073DF2CF|nr:hypothetical protein [Magnetospirillum sp. XM-1]CUW41904.1 protein of unknown function [Magnetospirillum sp. XM-1]
MAIIRLGECDGLDDWRWRFDAVAFSRRPGSVLAVGAELLSEASGGSVDPGSLLLLAEGGAKGKPRTLVLRWGGGADPDRLAAIREAVKSLGGRYNGCAKTWTIDDGAAADAVLAALSPWFSHAFDLRSGILHALGGAPALPVAGHGLLPEMRLVEFRAVAEALEDAGVELRSDRFEAYDRMEDRCGFRPIGPRADGSEPCGFPTRHGLVLLRAHQSGSSHRVLVWNVAERRIEELAWAKGAVHLLGRFGESLRAIREPVILPGYGPDCGIDSLLRLAEDAFEWHTGFRLRFEDARTFPDEGPAFVETLKPVRLDGAEIERLWASMDEDRAHCIMELVFGAVARELDRSEAASAGMSDEEWRLEGLLHGLATTGADALLSPALRRCLFPQEGSLA